MKKTITLFMLSLILLIMVSGCNTEPKVETFTYDITVHGYIEVGSVESIPLSGANVVFTNENGKTFSGTTDANGFVKLTKLPAGWYSRTITRSGYIWSQLYDENVISDRIVTYYMSLTQ